MRFGKVMRRLARFHPNVPPKPRIERCVGSLGRQRSAMSEQPSSGSPVRRTRTGLNWPATSITAESPHTGQRGICGREHKIKPRKFAQTHSDEVIGGILGRALPREHGFAGSPMSESTASSQRNPASRFARFLGSALSYCIDGRRPVRRIRSDAFNTERSAACRL